MRWVFVDCFFHGVRFTAITTARTTMRTINAAIAIISGVGEETVPGVGEGAEVETGELFDDAFRFITVTVPPSGFVM